MSHAEPERMDAEGYFALAGTLKALGQYEESITAYMNAADVGADYAEAHCDCAIVLQELGRLTEAAQAHRRAITIQPDYAKAHCYLGLVQAAQGQDRNAIRSYERALHIKPAYAKAHFFTGLTMKESGRTDEAVDAFRRAIGLKPRYTKAHYNLSMALLAQGNGVEALDVLDAFLKDDPGHTRMLAFKGVVLRELGRDEDADRLADFDKFIRSATITAPDGFDSLGAFNRALVESVMSHASLVREPTSRATRHGMHTGEILADAVGPVAVLADIIRRRVRAYMDALPQDDSHPFSANRPDKWGLGGWSVVMESQGHELTHIHPDGWLSGVYYVRVPKAVSTAGEGQDGWLEIGQPRAHYPCHVDYPVLALRPDEGVMRMFPSYFYHRTIPFQSDEKRICIAFDVNPELH